MQTQTNPSGSFGLQDLVDALRQRIDLDTQLLSQVMSYWTSEKPVQPLRLLDDLTPVNDAAAIERETDGKVTQNQIRWDARNRQQNGLAPAFTTIGNRLYVNIPEYIRLKSKRQGLSA